MSINTTLPTVTAEVLHEFDQTIEAASPELRELLFALRQIMLPGDRNLSNQVRREFGYGFGWFGASAGGVVDVGDGR